MAEEDTLFGLDIVKDFILAKGGKTTNHELVTHFKSFLNNPKWKNQNRQKFKEIVNTLATVKLDESGEKVLVLKKKYRDGGASFQAADMTSSLLKDLPKQRPKAKKARLAEQFESTLTPETPSADFSLSSSEDKVSPQQSEVQVGPPLSEMIAREIGEIMTGEEQSGESGSSSLSNSEPEQLVTEPEQPREVAPPPMLMVEEDIVPEEPPAAGAEDTSYDQAEDTQRYGNEEYGQGYSEEEDRQCYDDGEAQQRDEGAAAAVARPGGDTDGGAHVADDAADTNGAASVIDSMASTPAPNKQQSDAILEGASVSVRARAQHLNKIESLSSLQSAAGAQKGERTSKAAGAADDEDSNSESSMTVTLTDVERKWMMDASKCDYHELAKALNASPKLARYKVSDAAVCLSVSSSPYVYRIISAVF